MSRCVKREAGVGGVSKRLRPVANVDGWPYLAAPVQSNARRTEPVVSIELPQGAPPPTKSEPHRLFYWTRQLVSVAQPRAQPQLAVILPGQRGPPALAFGPRAGVSRQCSPRLRPTD